MAAEAKLAEEPEPGEILAAAAPRPEELQLLAPRDPLPKLEELIAAATGPSVDPVSEHAVLSGGFDAVASNLTRCLKLNIRFLWTRPERQRGAGTAQHARWPACWLCTAPGCLICHSSASCALVWPWCTYLDSPDAGHQR